MSSALALAAASVLASAFGVTLMRMWRERACSGTWYSDWCCVVVGLNLLLRGLRNAAGKLVGREGEVGDLALLPAPRARSAPRSS